MLIIPLLFSPEFLPRRKLGQHPRSQRVSRRSGPVCTSSPSRRWLPAARLGSRPVSPHRSCRSPSGLTPTESQSHIQLWLLCAKLRSHHGCLRTAGTGMSLGISSSEVFENMLAQDTETRAGVRIRLATLTGISISRTLQ